MNSTPNIKDVLIARADEQLARVRERIASADEQMARVTEQLLKMERDDARNPSARPGDDARNSSARPGDEARNPSARPADEARNPSTRPGRQPPGGKSAVPGLTGLLPIGLLLAACLVVAALVSQIAARWTPQHVSTPFSQPTNPQLSAQPGPSFKLITAEAAPAQAAQLARTGPQDAAPAAAGVSELMQMQQTMARDVANLKQEIEQLKVKRDQIATDNSKAVEQLKAKQEDVARLSAKVPEQSASAKTSPPSAGPTQSLARMRPQAPPPRRRYPPRWRYYDDEW